MTREDELFEEVKLLNRQNIDIYERYCNLLKSQNEKDLKQNIELMRAIVHNKILLMVILSKLGMEDDEIDTLNKTIYDTLDKSMNDFLKGDNNEEESSNKD